VSTKRLHPFFLAALLLAGLGITFAGQLGADEQKDQGGLDLTKLLNPPYNEMEIVTKRYGADHGNLTKFYNVNSSPTRHVRLKRFYTDWQTALNKVDADKLSNAAKADWQTLKKRVARDLAAVESETKADAEVEALMPFATVITALLESHQRVDKMDGMKAAAGLNTVKLQIAQMKKNVAAGKGNDKGLKVTQAMADRAAATTTNLKTGLNTWYGFYNGYDPGFMFWCVDLYKDVDKALGDYATLVKKTGGNTIAPCTITLPEWAKPGDAKNPRPAAFPVTPTDVPDLAELLARKPSEMRDVFAKFQTDRGGGGGKGMGGAGGGKKGGGKGAGGNTKAFRDMWMAALAKIDFDKLSQEGKVDYLVIKHSFDRDAKRAEIQKKSDEAMAKLVPFEPLVDKLEVAMLKKDKIDPASAGPVLKELVEAVDKAHAATDLAWKNKDTAHPVFASRISVTAAQDMIKELRASVTKWVALGSADAQFAKDALEPSKAVDAAMQKYSTLLSSTGGMKADGSGITGRPIGRDALLVELFAEMVAATPEDLLKIADQEYAFCEAEMIKASREMGCGDDWLKAVEKVKQAAVPAGDQPVGIRDLVWEAIDYLWKKDLITVPSVAGETWLMSMMSPKQQLVNPFFTGGARISVSYPHTTMPFDARIQSMRGNNLHFSKATAHHEVIPGHNLQQFMNARYGNKRGLGTPFWTEGGALYWEFVLYEKGFAAKPEDRVGFMFWRMHRCARIHFSLNFHMGKWTPQQCIDYLVTKVGHERDNAAGEVRRSFETNYGPLYQLAYMIGGKQLYALRKELVLSGKMPEKEFHDKIWQGGGQPIELVRMLVANPPLTRDWTPSWKFAE